MPQVAQLSKAAKMPGGWAGVKGKTAAKNSSKGKPVAKAAKTANGKSTSTAIAKRPALTMANIEKAQKAGAAMERARLAANGRLAPANVEANKKGHKKKAKGKNKRNGSEGVFGLLASPFRAMRNASVSNILGTVKAAAIGVGGAAATRIGAGILLGVGDRFAPAYAGMPYAPPVVTALLAIFGLPWVMQKVGITDRATQNTAVTGGVLFAAGEAANIALGGDKAQQIADDLRARVSGNTVPAGATAATVGAAVGAQNADEAQAAHSGAMAGLAHARGQTRANFPRPMPAQWERGTGTNGGARRGPLGGTVYN